MGLADVADFVTQQTNPSIAMLVAKEKPTCVVTKTVANLRIGLERVRDKVTWAELELPRGGTQN